MAAEDRRQVDHRMTRFHPHRPIGRILSRLRHHVRSRFVVPVHPDSETLVQDTRVPRLLFLLSLRRVGIGALPHRIRMLCRRRRVRLRFGIVRIEAGLVRQFLRLEVRLLRLQLRLHCACRPLLVPGRRLLPLLLPRRRIHLRRLRPPLRRRDQRRPL